MLQYNYSKVGCEERIVRMDYFLKYIFDYEWENIIRLTPDTQWLLLECALEERNDNSYVDFFKHCAKANVSLADNPNSIVFYKLFDNEYDGRDDYADDFVKLFGTSGEVFNTAMNEAIRKENIFLICSFLNKGILNPSAEIAKILLDSAEDYYESYGISHFDRFCKDLFKKSATILRNAGYLTEDDLSGEVWNHCFDTED